jgi:hypothetical protein
MKGDNHVCHPNAGFVAIQNRTIGCFDVSASNRGEGPFTVDKR